MRIFPVLQVITQGQGQTKTSEVQFPTGKKLRLSTFIQELTNHQNKPMHVMLPIMEKMIHIQQQKVTINIHQ